MRRFMAVSATVTLFAVFGLAGATRPVVAQTDEPTTVVDYETVFASLDSDGSPRNVRLVDTIRVSGEGDVVFTDPTSTEDFRVLSGFQSPEVGDGEVTYTIEDLSGTEEFVTASTPDVNPPVGMRVTYYLNGELVEAEDVVGETGRVTIVFDITNDTGAPTELTYKDAAGEEQSFTQDVPIPMVAQLQMELPGDRVSNIFAPDAEKITDPQGDITLQFSMVMIPPIGSTVQSPEIMMDAEDFELGAIRLLAVPVAPVEREFLAFAEEEFQGGVDRASGLYAGATELSSSIGELHDGTLDLLDGMQELFDGAKELAAGLQEAFAGSGELTAGLGEAATGSAKITAGAGEAAAGSGKITAGLGKAKAGSGELKTGLRDAKKGSGKITSGIGELKGGLGMIGGGLDQLAQGLPAGQKGAEDISAAADGIQQIAAGLANSIAGPSPSIKAGAQGIQQIAAALAANITAGAADAENCLTGTGSACGGGGSIGGLAALIAAACPAITGCSAAGITAAANAIGAKAAGLATALTTGATDAANCLTGSGTPCSGSPSITSIAASIETGADLAAACLIGPGAPCSEPMTLRGGIEAIRQGALLLATGVAEAIAGVGQLSAGVNEAIEGSQRLFAGSSELTAGLGDAVAGSGELTSGLGELKAGSGKLTSGLGELKAGSGKLTTGLNEAHAGSGKLTAGLDEAASGSGRLADGIGKAKEGAGQIEQGVYSVNELGVKEIARGANETVSELARSLALMKAQDQRANEEALTYGPPASDQAETVVGGSGVVLTMDQLDNRGTESAVRGVAAAVGFLALVGLGLLGARSLSRKPG